MHTSAKFEQNIQFSLTAMDGRYIVIIHGPSNKAIIVYYIVIKYTLRTVMVIDRESKWCTIPERGIMFLNQIRRTRVSHK